jgi:hypothetical protein
MKGSPMDLFLVADVNGNGCRTAAVRVTVLVYEGRTTAQKPCPTEGTAAELAPDQIGKDSTL